MFFLHLEMILQMPINWEIEHQQEILFPKMEFQEMYVTEAVLWHITNAQH